MSHPHLECTIPVERAVAFESVIVAHGLPRPRNLEVARRCEAHAIAAGATPATIAIIPGRGVVAGISDADLVEIANRDDVVKANSANLAAVIARQQWAATTVATSLWACARAGIRVFVTGGIGGVHRGFAQTLDISADLPALAREPVAVICSGVKSILDVAATREYLETLGVPVVGYRTNTMPRFYVRDSDLPVDVRCETPQEVVAFLRVHFSVSSGAALIVQPVPEEAAFTDKQMADALAAAEEIVHRSGAPRGRDVTPAILSALRDSTNGRSLEANVALIENNAKLGGEVAAALSASSASLRN